MPTAPEGSLSLALDVMKATLAASARFQTLVGALDATEALNSIYADALPVPANKEEYTRAELEGYRPYAMVMLTPDEEFRGQQDAVSSDGFERSDAGSFLIDLVQDIPAGVLNDLSESELLWRNTVGVIYDELWALAGNPGYIAAAEITVKQIDRGHPDDVTANGNWQGALFQVNFNED